MDERDVLRAIEIANQALSKVESLEKALNMHMTWHREQILSLSQSDVAIRTDLKAGFSEMQLMFAKHTEDESRWREADSRRWANLSWVVIGALVSLAATLAGYIWTTTVG